MLNALSVDVEEYFQVANFSQSISKDSWDAIPRRSDGVTKRLLDLFEQYDVRATFFVLGWLAEREPGLIREIVARGHEVASHGYSHQLIYEQGEVVFAEETRQSKALLEDITGVPVRGYRAASFSITSKSLWALDILAEQGFEYDSSIFPTLHDRYGISGAPKQPVVLETLSGATIQEFPLTTLRLAGADLPISGGGYFRLYPYSFTRYGLNLVNTRDSRPFIFYCHPWEFDPDQPRVKAPWFNRWRHYQNMGRSSARLEKLVQDFRFGSVADVLNEQELSTLKLSDFVQPEVA
jgi:polysaccharide deacetylase family protein (PEP-CTERM system associated)